jgi:UDP-N-acetylmuramate dehydrogenase
LHEIGLIGSEIDQMYPMSKYLITCGGLADILVTPNNLEEFKKLLDLLTRSGEPWVVLGAGSNTVVYDTGIEGVVVSTRKLKKIEITDQDKVYAETGAVLGTILNKTIKAGLTGFEFAAGIPGPSAGSS